MQTIKYKLADGKTVDIEVSDEVAEVYEQIVTYEKKVHRKETRRHNSLESMQDKGFDFADENGDVEETLEREAKYAEELELDDLEFAREERFLDRKKNYLEHNLTPRQAQAYFEFTYLHLKKVRIAENMHIAEGAVRKLILKAEENLAKMREKRQEEILQSAREKGNKNKRLNKRENEALNLLLLQTLFEEK